MGKGYGIASLILAIIGIFVGGIILGPIAIILGIMGRKRDDSKGLATAGLIIGIIVTILAIIFLIVWGAYVIGGASNGSGASSEGGAPSGGTAFGE